VKRALSVRAIAEADIEAAFRWYEEKGAALGRRFLEAVDVGFAAIQRNPEHYPVVFKRARRILLHHFPYGLLYLIRDEYVEVVGCLHSRRNPRLWRRRLLDVE
jgi:toxin ParE1/3/4